MKSNWRNLYKNHSRSNQQDLRTRRHEVTVELRKAKKEDQLFKRRNINEEELVSPLKENSGQSPVQMNIDEIVAAMNSQDADRQFAGTQAVRKMLSREWNPPIDVIISHGIVPICVRFLQRNENNLLQFEAAWALTNIAFGNSSQTNCVIESNAIPHLVALLDSKSISVAEQSIWALGNIAGDGSKARDIIISHKVIEGILKLMQKDIPISFMHNIVWLMLNLCRNKDPTPPFEQIRHLLPVLAELIGRRDIQVVSDACWAFSYVTDDDNVKIQAVVDTGAVPKLVNLLESEELKIIVPALRTVGNIVTGTDQQTDIVINAGGLSKLRVLLQHTKRYIVEEAAWTISNITAGNKRQVQAVLDAGIFEHIRNVLEKGDFKAQREAAWVVTNTTICGSPEQVLDLIEKYKILKPFCDLLAAKDAQTIKVVLKGIGNLFASTDKLGGTENLCLIMEEIGGLDKLELLQTHENEEIYKKAYAIVDNYFTDDSEESELAPSEGASEFVPPSQGNVPEGGFNF